MDGVISRNVRGDSAGNLQTSSTTAYYDAIQFLYDLQWFGTRPGLEITFKLADLAGNPQRGLRFIHVAGTNGKGSTCAMLESIYRSAGLRVGLFTSPHLVAFGERIQINREFIGEADLVRLVAGMKPWLATFPSDSSPTFFEVTTVMALQYFAEQKCDLVIWEAGLGGRLDATNIVTPLASVITNIQFDHQAWLGDTLARIATEKAGIIKPGIPLITAVDDTDAFVILYETARRNKSPFWLITWAQAGAPPLDQVILPLLGEHQRLNAAVAAYTVRAIAHQIPINDNQIQTGLRNVQWPGRLQLVERNRPATATHADAAANFMSGRPGKKLLLDGAHNIGGAEALRVAVQTYFSMEKITLILGILEDKDCERICEIVAPLASRIILTRVKSKRSSTPKGLLPACRQASPKALILEAESLAESLVLAREDAFVIIAGSLYLIGEALDLLKLAPATSIDERGLNEWIGTPKSK